ncbi:hypothetical protein [Portibacter lacus]|uniref:Uncharacterized protein n=1 Tax=Portibacter lacus TaxID=1099794 RepID=A0AA37SS35_9BACT|nr:hypothetical protein [Portibacter lacus]GLR17133.1 hypothetical protein GCM10007940_17480 [Portibacter lacus]
MKSKLIGLCLLIIFGCESEVVQKESAINTDHLDHLYEEYEVNGEQIGSIWIYCEAPDYHHVTDEDEGYTCVDDVARSLVLYVNLYKESPSKKVEEKIVTLSNFVLNMQAENGYFYNFVFPDKSINKTHQNSVAEANWWSWRAFWALSEVASLDDSVFSELKEEALSSMKRLLPLMMEICANKEEVFTTEGIVTPTCVKDIGGDQLALLMIGLSNFYELEPSEELKQKLEEFGGILEGLQLGDEEEFPYFASMSWQNIWHAWGNSQAYAMLKVGRLLENETMIKAGQREVEYFIPHYLKEKPSFFKLAKSEDGYEVMETEAFPQIAYNLRPMIYAALEAYEVNKNPSYKKIAIDLGNWYLGDNQANQQMYDPKTGITFDGIISMTEVNKNSGAESTIEALLALQAISKYPEIWNEVKMNLTN